MFMKNEKASVREGKNFIVSQMEHYSEEKKGSWQKELLLSSILLKFEQQEGRILTWSQKKRK